MQALSWESTTLDTTRLRISTFDLIGGVYLPPVGVPMAFGVWTHWIYQPQISLLCIPHPVFCSTTLSSVFRKNQP